jgi:hypothetical protein
LRPQTVGRTSFSVDQPLKHVASLMRECSGTMIVAFERVYIERGAERRGSENELRLGECGLPTVWNQIEATMSYVLDLPLMVLVEHGLRSEGLLEKGYDWYVQWVDLDATTLKGAEFRGVFDDWKSRVKSRAGSRSDDSPMQTAAAAEWESAGAQPWRSPRCESHRPSWPRAMTARKTNPTMSMTVMTSLPSSAVVFSAATTREARRSAITARSYSTRSR